jgi:hypothetical protein
MFSVCVVCAFSVFVYRQRPCDELNTLQEVLQTVLDLVNEAKRKVSWGRPRIELGCRAKGGRNVSMNYLNLIKTVTVDFEKIAIGAYLKDHYFWSCNVSIHLSLTQDG